MWLSSIYVDGTGTTPAVGWTQFGCALHQRQASVSYLLVGKGLLQWENILTANSFQSLTVQH